MDPHSAIIPSPNEWISRARADLRMGLPVVMSDGDARMLVAAAETVSDDRIRAMKADGEAVLVVTGRRATTLKIRAYDGDLARIALPEGATRADLLAIIDPKGDLDTPMKGPFRTLRGGSAALHRAAIALTKSARLLPAVLVAPCHSIPSGLTEVDVAAVLPGKAASLAHVVSARLPTEVADDTRLHIFRPGDGGEEHYAVEIARPERGSPVLVRLHSACFTGDVLGSRKCDCGPQLRGALGQMATGGGGVLLYLNQEGRGIGLANKLRAYALQDQGYDTVEANHRLGFEDDERDFRIGAAMLRTMRISRVRLLTNNPRKVEMLERCGIEVVDRIPLWVGENPHNADYLRIKSEKSGHLR